MHIRRLTDFLNETCGQPTRMEGGEAYRWEFKRKANHMVSVCVSINEQARQAAMWIFDPGSDETATYRRVNNQIELKGALAYLDKRLARKRPAGGVAGVESSPHSVEASSGE